METCHKIIVLIYSSENKFPLTNLQKTTLHQCMNTNCTLKTNIICAEILEQSRNDQKHLELLIKVSKSLPLLIKVSTRFTVNYTKRNLQICLCHLCVLRHRVKHS